MTAHILAPLLGAIVLIGLPSLAMRTLAAHRKPMPERERCPGCEHMPLWVAGCDECDGKGYIQ